MTYTREIFMDSGAWAICRLHVLKQGKRAERIGKHGRLLEETTVRGAQGDFSYYNLAAGSPFREYCDGYAAFVKEHTAQVKLFANIDAIGSPSKTWEIQLYFEKEHGLKLVPVIHCGTSLRWIDRYLDRGYDIIGLGGFARKIARTDVIRWCDEVFVHICPKSNGYKPIVRVHGFALTAWDFMRRWPWYCVDSTSWVKYSAYGWIVVPRRGPKGFRYDKPPMVVNMSWRSPFKADRHKHLDNVLGSVKDTVLAWLESLNIPVGKVDKDGNELEGGVISSHMYRSTVNLHYFLNLQDSLPKWPWPLDPHIVHGKGTHYHKGFDLV